MNSVNEKLESECKVQYNSYFSLAKTDYLFFSTILRVTAYVIQQVQKAEHGPVKFDHQLFSLLTYPPLHVVVCRLGSWHASVFGPLPSQ